jgi:hypothetical protein
MILSFSGSVAATTNVVQYPAVIAASSKSSTASLSVVYELARANSDLVVPDYISLPAPPLLTYTTLIQIRQTL